MFLLQVEWSTPSNPNNLHSHDGGGLLRLPYHHHKSFNEVCETRVGNHGWPGHRDGSVRMDLGSDQLGLESLGAVELSGQTPGSRPVDCSCG